MTRITPNHTRYILPAYYALHPTCNFRWRVGKLRRPPACYALHSTCNPHSRPPPKASGLARIKGLHGLKPSTIARLC